MKAIVKKSIITYQAIPHPIRGQYLENLIELGLDCCKLREVAETTEDPVDIKAYEKVKRTLEIFEDSIRGVFGETITRKVLP